MIYSLLAASALFNDQDKDPRMVIKTKVTMVLKYRLFIV